MTFDSPRPKILYIDDEQINLGNFRQAFGDHYCLYTASSAEQARQILNKEGEMALVITDQRMPGTSGIELLTRIASDYPDTVRIILTAYTDAREIIEAINRGHVFRYIVKPWDENDLGLSIRSAAELYKLSKQNAALLEELEEKSVSLARMNAELEERVAARTRQLHETNLLLKQNNDQLTIAHLKEKEMSSELAELNWALRDRFAELQKAVESIRDLQKLLPVCIRCRKMRDDQEYLQDLNLYMQKYPEYTFSQSLCPACLQQHGEDGIEGKKAGEDEEI